MIARLDVTTWWVACSSFSGFGSLPFILIVSKLDQVPTKYTRSTPVPDTGGVSQPFSRMIAVVLFIIYRLTHRVYKALFSRVLSLLSPPMARSMGALLIVCLPVCCLRHTIVASVIRLWIAYDNDLLYPRYLVGNMLIISYHSIPYHIIQYHII